MPPKNPRWAEPELILALDLYLRSGLLDDKDEAVVDLSRVLKELTIHPDRPDAERFRNENGVALKLANFAAIDPNHKGKGMTSYGKLDAEVWARFASDEDSLATAAAAIRAGHEAPANDPADPTGPIIDEIEVEAQHVEEFQVTIPGKETVGRRREQSLVLAYREHLESLGHKISRHRYQPPSAGAPLVCDLVDESAEVLYEAKGDVRRTSVRMAIGQLLDYRRFEPPTMDIAVLLPRRPADDLISLVGSVPATTVWRTQDGFKST
ncbi:MAG: hypothetical protein OXN86_00485 [Chloroflexota bacterium]|nr:hypothetical protein [Chloroflexota bacterium]